MMLHTEKSNAEIIATCKAMIKGELNLIEGSRKLSSISRNIASIEDEIFHPFIGVDSETDHFPLGEMRSQSSESFLKKSDAEMSAYLEDVGQEIIEACKRLIDYIDQSDND